MTHPFFYLKKLSLYNFATFKQQSMSFGPHYNAIIGETGSGKSLILEALEILLGGVADKKWIRSKAPFATVEAVFLCHHESVTQFFLEKGYPFEGNEIVIKRVIYAERRSQSFLNYQQCTRQTLQEVANHFIDFVGQFENQKLLQHQYQLLLLDRYGDLLGDLEIFEKSFDKWQETKQKLLDLREKKSKQHERQDYIHYLLQELDEINPTPEEETKLLEDKKIFQLKDKRRGILEQVLGLLSEDEGRPVLGGLKKISSLIQKNEDCFLEGHMGLLESARASLEELSYSISNLLYENEISVDIDHIMTRLSQYQKLKTKYRKEIVDILELKKSLLEELHLFASFDEQESLLTKEEALQEGELKKMGHTLYLKRLEVAHNISEKLTQKIQSLNMTGATIKMELEELDHLNRSGGVKVTLLAQTNPGEGFYPFKDIASGGELSRLLLVCRQLLSTKDLMTIFLFDEIDSGMGGNTAMLVGEALKEMSVMSQLLVITHLPQMAYFADKIILVQKEKGADPLQLEQRTQSIIQEISGDDRLKVIKDMVPLTLSF